MHMISAQMNGMHLNGKVHGSEKAVPGCLGRMVNLFDLTSGVSGNRLLTDKPHNDGSLSRSRSDVSRMSRIAGDEMEDKVMVSELKRSSSNTKSYGTPVKMLIAQEMSKDLELRHNTPNVVAKLMGLDALPKQQPDTATQRTPKSHARKCHSEIPVGYWQEEDGYYADKVNSDLHPHQVQNECKDIHEILQQSQRTYCQRDKSPQKGRSNEKVNDKRLTLIRQKFVEAKRLATDEKLRQTKEFQDALDVLSSNGDLFLKVLQEPNSLFSEHLNGVQPIPLSPETKRITVLRPSKLMADEKQVKKSFQVNQVNLWESHSNGFSPTLSTTQPTRIVVLKPGPGKVNGPKTALSSTPSSPRVPKSENFFVEPEDEEAREAREVAKEITQQMRENLAGHRRNETLLSSVFSNGYTGDESSFEKSENEFAVGNLSDSEVLSPTSRHSWDYVNRFGSPYSVSSFSRASFSPESSVCREAKKRLSERWAMMASNGSIQEQRPFRSSSSTLGEMLALSEIKKPEICEVEESDNKAENPRASTSFLYNNVGVGESGDESPRNLLRSKSVPISSSEAYRDGLSVEVPKPLICKADIPKDILKTKTPKTSFAGKVTSLFFSKNKKCRKDKPASLQSIDEFQSVSDDTPGSIAPPGRLNNDHSHSEAALSSSEMHSGTISVDKRGFHQGALSMSQSCTPGIQGENHDQPSPISVLEQSFEEEEGVILNCSRSIDPHAGKPLSLGLSKSNLIDKSPPIGSIARTLSWDECCTETATNYPLNSPFVSPGAEDDEGEWLYLVQSLLTMAGLDDEGQLGSNMARWHSPKSPLDPLLREKYIDLTSKEPLHEAKRRQLRSTRKLLFDSVNAALVDIIGFGTPSTQLASPYLAPPNGLLESEPTSLADKVWAWMKEWLSIDGGDSNSLVERWVMKEVVGPGWTNQINMEIDNISKEIEGKMLEELVEESVVEWTGRRDC
ncbi:uncharacterized protein LOC141639634 isoform X1 [Silene latifolia]|uniref:uncharacterized protein LOC141639634 isoform X1 n=2 Tax=Silene latifolia TaxID=37657 RepID=UPI003D771D4A